MATIAGQSRLTQPAAAMLDGIREQFLSELAASVSWFYAQMPAHYFLVTTPQEQALHLEMIHMARRSGEPRLSVIDDRANGKLLVFGIPERHSLMEVMALIATR